MSQQPARKRRDPDATRGAILDAAEQLFIEHGLAKVSVREVAERSGVTKSLIHHHYGSKTELWEAVKQRCFEDYAEVQMHLLQTGGADERLLRDSVRAYFDYLKANPNVVRLLTWAHLEDDCAQVDAELVSAGAAKLREAQAAGALRADIDAVHIVVTFVAVTMQWFEARGHFLQWEDMAPEQRDEDERFLRSFLSILFEGVRPS